jgi:hypothetical protein
MADPDLFKLRFVKSRDMKVVAVVALFLGGFVGRAILDKLGSAPTFLIGAGFRVLIAAWWLIVRGEKPGDEEK